MFSHLDGGDEGLEQLRLAKLTQEPQSAPSDVLIRVVQVVTQRVTYLKRESVRMEGGGVREKGVKEKIARWVEEGAQQGFPAEQGVMYSGGEALAWFSLKQDVRYAFHGKIWQLGS